MNIITVVFALSSSLALVPTAAFSASDTIVIEQATPENYWPTCLIDLTPDLLLGDYQVETSPLRMNIGGITRVFEEWETGTARIYLDDLRGYVLGDLGAPIPEIRLVEADRLEPNWYWGENSVPSLAENRLPGMPPDIRFPEAWEALLNEYINRNPNTTSSLNLIDGLSSAEFEENIRCQIRELPRLVGQFTTTAEDGTPLEHTMRLILWRDGGLFGQWTWIANAPQGTVTAVRAIFLED